MRNQTHVARFAGLLLVFFAGLLLPARLQADGMFVVPKFVWNKQKDINEPTQKAILVYDAGREDMILQVKYDGPVEEFGWLVPVPGMPKVQKGSMDCFYELSQYTQRLWEPPVYGTKSRGMMNSLSAGDAGAEPPPVKVIEIKTVGAYEIAVLSTKDTGALENWLNANQFYFPTNKSDVLDAYVRQQWYFVAVKINLGKSLFSAFGTSRKLASGELNPLHISFASDRCVFPLKISSVNGTPSEVQVYVLSPEPLVERTQFEKKFPEVRRLAQEQNVRRFQMMQRNRQVASAFRRRMHPEEGADLEPPVETNIPMNLMLRPAVPHEALLPYAEVTEKELPVCARKLPRLHGKSWWLTKQTWTFQPEEMRDLVFQPAAAVFAADLAGDEGYYVAQNLARLGSSAVPALLTALQNPNPVVRIHAASILEDSGGQVSPVRDSRVRDCLPALFNDTEAEVRMDAASAAGGEWQPQFAGPLIRLLRDEDDGVQHAAVFALRRNAQGRQEHQPELLALLKDDNLAVRANALEVLAGLDVPVQRADVLPLLSVTNIRVVNVALSRLEQDGVSYEHLTPLLQNPLMEARLAALTDLQRLGNKASIDIVIPLLRDPAQPVRGRAWRLLRELTGQEFRQDQPDQWEQWWAENKIAFMLADYTKTIKSNPNDGWAYHNRGCLYYNLQRFNDALADFHKSCELGSEVQDYSYYRIWLIRARSGELEAAKLDLLTYLEHRQTGLPDDWPAKVGRFLAGQLTEAGFLKAAADPDAGPTTNNIARRISTSARNG